MAASFSNVRLGGRGTSAEGKLSISEAGLSWLKEGVRGELACAADCAAMTPRVGCSIFRALSALCDAMRLCAVYTSNTHCSARECFAGDAPYADATCSSCRSCLMDTPTFALLQQPCSMLALRRRQHDTLRGGSMHCVGVPSQLRAHWACSAAVCGAGQQPQDH